MQGQDDRQAYDRGTSLFSPDGRIHQVEYARKAVRRGSPSIGVRSEEGVALIASIGQQPDLVVNDSVEKIHQADQHIGAASAGHIADGRKLVEYARQQAQQERVRYDEATDVESLTKEITDHVQQFTQRGGTRPFGAALLVAGVDETGPSLHEVGPAGSTRAYHAKAIGREEKDIMDFLSSNYQEELNIEEAVALGVDALEDALGEDNITDNTVEIATVVPERGFRYHDRSVM